MKTEWALPAIIACRCCNGEMAIVNTRGRVDRSVVWRQRKCRRCGTIETTYESRELPNRDAKDAVTIARVRKALQQALAALEP